jgi:predicted AAA+ superfamily ATPase
MPVLSFREFLSLKNIAHFPIYSLENILKNHEDIAVNISQKIKPLALFQEYLEYGTYPFFKEGIISYPKRLLEVVTIIIDSDLSSIFNINSDKLDTPKKYSTCSVVPLLMR